MNQILTNFMMSLPKPHTRPLVDELVIKVLQACPDQLRWYLPSLKSSCAPRASGPWLQCMKFLMAVGVFLFLGAVYKCRHLPIHSNRTNPHPLPPKLILEDVDSFFHIDKFIDVIML